MNTIKKLWYIVILGVFTCVPIAASDKGYTVSGKGGYKESTGKEITYDAMYGQIASTFVTSDPDPDANLLLDTATINETNQSILDFITKKNKSLGFKNSDIEKISSEQFSLIISLVNTIKELKGTMYHFSSFDKNKSKIIDTLNSLYSKCIASAQNIEKVRSKKFPPITDTSKKLLDLSLALNKAVASFIPKLIRVISDS
jgi:hypothetical protein